MAAAARWKALRTIAIHRCLTQSGSKRRMTTPVATDPGSVVLRRIAAHVEENEKVAETLAPFLNADASAALSRALDGIKYEVVDPNWLALRRVAMQNAVPFVGFGIMDNAIMIVAGEYIDLKLGVAFGISTMAAAALGNLVSDIFGVGLGGAVESMAQRLGLPEPGLSRAQMKLPRTRAAGHVGCAVGITIGCLIGMFPLLLLPDARETEHSKQRGLLASKLDELLRDAAALLSADDVLLLDVDMQAGALRQRTKSAGGGGSKQGGGGIKGEESRRPSAAAWVAAAQAAATGSPTSAPPEGDFAGVMCVPVAGLDGRVVAVAMAVGKRQQRKGGGKGGEGGSAAGGDAKASQPFAAFSADDERRLTDVCGPLGLALRHMEGVDAAEKALAEASVALKASGGLHAVTKAAAASGKGAVDR